MAEESGQSHPQESLDELIEARDSEAVEQHVEALTPAELASSVAALSNQQQQELLVLLTPDEAADLVEDVPMEQAAPMIEDMEPATAAAIVGEMRSDHRADLLERLDDEDSEAILRAMEPGAAEDARQLLEYDPDTAGGIMVTEFLSYTADEQIIDVLEDLRVNGESYGSFQVQYAYVVSPQGVLVGVLPLRDLLLAPRMKRLEDAMISQPIHVGVDTSLEELGQFFDKHGFLGVPVVDGAGLLVGVALRSEVDRAVEHHAEKTYLETSGIVGGEELRAMPLWTRAGRRLSWLSVNILLNIAAASVIALYQDTLSAVIVLAVFLPIISDMSGCSGNQAVAVSIRELTLGLAHPGDVWRVLYKEGLVGLVNGTVLGGLLGGVAWLWKGNPYLGLVVGLALAANTLVAVLLGGLIPLVLRGLGKDPALASGPLLTTVTDMFGFFLVLSLASMLLAHLL